MSNRLANQKKATEDFLDAWRRLSVNDIVKGREDDCVQFSLPKQSLHMPEQSNADFIAALTPAFDMLSNFKVDLHSVTHDPEVGRTVVHADTAADAVWGDYRNTHIMIFHWNEDGDKMMKVEDMMDSAGIVARLPLIQAYMEKQKAA